MDLSKSRAMLASTFGLALILQGTAFVPIPAQAQSEWTGTIETNLKYTWTEFDGTRTVEITRSAGISFTVPDDPYSFGDITGDGSGSEEYHLHYVVSDGSGECPESYDSGSTGVNFELKGYVDQETGKAVLEMRQLTPYQYIVNRGCVGPYDSSGYYVNAFESWNAGSFEIDLNDGAVYDQDVGSGRQGFDRLVIHGSSGPPESFDYEISAEPTVTDVLQGEVARVDLTATLLSGKPEPVNVELYVVNNDARTHVEGYGLEDIPTFSFPYQIPISCEVNAGQYHFEFQAKTPNQNEAKTAAFTINVKENPDCVPINPSECPLLTITPTMPPASDPRNIASPTGQASYRFQVAWEGKTPIKVNFDVQGGDDSINPSFAFNPASMQSSPVSVLMDVITHGADEGTYPLVADAWVIDPETGEECHAEQAAAVTLVVGESRAIDLELIERTGQVEITPEETDDDRQNVLIETGDDGEVTFTVQNNPDHSADSDTTVQIANNTVIKEYGHVDHFAKMMDRIQQDREDQFQLVSSNHDPMIGKGPSTAEIIKNAIKSDLEKLWNGVKFDAIDMFSCLFAPGDSSIADVCSKKSLFYIWEGDVHIIDRSSRDQLIDRVNDPGIYVTDGAMIVPTGTDLIINVRQHDDLTMTTVTLLEESALIVDLASEQVHLVNAGEKYYLETSFAGAAASSNGRLESQIGNSLVDNQFVEYDPVAEVEADNAELETLFEGFIDDIILVQLAGLGTIDEDSGVYSYVPAETADDMQWLNVTVIDNSPQDVFLWHEVKVKGKPVEHIPSNINHSPSSPFFISTAGIGKGYVIDSHIDQYGYPPQLNFDRTVNLNIGGSSIAAYEFSGTVSDSSEDGTSELTVTAHYERDTGMLIDYLVAGRLSSSLYGDLRADFGLKATKVAIPTTLSITSIPSDISQNNNVVVTGKASPAVSEGQVVLTYQKDGSEPIRRTVPVSNGAFSDSYMMEEDGTYAVSAEYLGSGAYLSSTADAKTLTVSPSGCLIATAAYGSEFAPQVQMLRQIRDGQLLSTSSGSAFMSTFNSVYYSFSPTVADWERENPAFREAVRIAITPLITTLGILPHVSMDSEAEALGYGIGIILLNIGIYFVAPAFAVMALRSKFGKKKLPS